MPSARTRLACVRCGATVVARGRFAACFINYNLRVVRVSERMKYAARILHTEIAVDGERVQPVSRDTFNAFLPTTRFYICRVMYRRTRMRCCVGAAAASAPRGS